MCNIPRFYLGLGLAAIGLVTLIVGLALGGGPGYARKQARDQRRTEALMNANGEIVSLYTQNNRLPDTTEYRERLEGIGYIRDRFKETEIWDELLTAYRPTGAETYELCGDFETNTRVPQQYPRDLKQSEEFPDFYSHLGERTCFSARISAYISNEAAERRANAASSTTP